MKLYSLPEAKGFQPVGWLSSISTNVEEVTSPKDLIERSSILIFWGGADICPQLYGQLPSVKVSAKKPSDRDLLEYECGIRAIELGIPMLGICRGAQMVTILAGGHLIQDCTGHTGTQHQLETVEGKMMGNSDHHQMMDPFGTAYELLAWTPKEQGTTFFGPSLAKMPIPRHPEVVHYRLINGLAIQGHPEWANASPEYIEFCKRMIEKKLLS